MPPTAPTGLVVSTSGFFGELSLNWTDTPGATSYRVYRSGVTGGPYTLIATTLVSNYLDVNLPLHSTAYYYYVTAVDVSGESTESSEAFATTPAPGASPPRQIPPENFSAVGGNEYVDLSWLEGAADVRAWHIYKSLTQASGFVEIVAVGQPTYRDFDVINDITYYYYVTADNLLESAPSDTFTVIPTPGPQARRTGFYHVLHLTIPAPVDYILLKGSAGTIWMYQVDSAGLLEVSPYDPHPGRIFNRRGRCIIPFAPEHEYGMPRRADSAYRAAIRGRYGTDRIPRYLQCTDQVGTTRYIFPVDASGNLLSTTIAPTALTYPIGAGAILYGQAPGTSWIFAGHSTSVYTLTASSAVGTTELIRVSTPKRTAFVNGQNYPHRLMEPIVISSSFDVGSQEDFGQQVSRSIANDVTDAILENRDGRYDFLANTYMRSRPIECLRGLDPDPDQLGLTSFYKGIVDKVEKDDHRLVISLTNPSDRFKQAIQTSFFAGTGGVEGTVDVADRPRDIIYGCPIYFEPTMIDDVNRVYALGDIQIAQVAAGTPVTQTGQHVMVRFKQVPTIFVNDVFNWTPVLGQAVISGAQRLMRLGSEPDGLVLVSLYAGHASLHQVHRPGDVILDVLSRMGFSASEYDDPSIQLIRSTSPQILRLHFSGSKSWTAEEVLDVTCKQIGAIWGFDPLTGQFYAKKFSLNQTPVAFFNHANISPEGIRFNDTGLVPGTMRYGFNPTGRQFSEQDVVAGAEGFNRFRARTPYIRGRNQQIAGQSLPNLPEPEVFFSVAFTTDMDLSFGDHLIYMEPRDAIQFRGFGIFDALRVGDVINVRHPRYGISLGQNFIATALQKDSVRGTIDVEAWG